MTTSHDTAPGYAQCEQSPTDEGGRKTGYCIFIDTILQGTVPVELDAEGRPIVYPSLEEAQRVIAEDTIDRLNEFLEGKRDYDDAITVEEYVQEVQLCAKEHLSV